MLSSHIWSYNRLLKHELKKHELKMQMKLRLQQVFTGQDVPTSESWERHQRGKTCLCCAVAEAGHVLPAAGNTMKALVPLQAKLAQLHRHAEVMMESVLNNPNITEESVKAMAQHERCALLLNVHIWC